jgi:hypothetical protein
MKLFYYCTFAATISLAAAGMIGAAAQDHPAPPMSMMGLMGTTDHVEGRIAFLKAELKITDAQLPQWNAFADALRNNAKRRAEALETRAQRTAPNALDRLDRIEKMMTMMLETVRSTKTALGPLYAVLNDEQKKMADTLLRGPIIAEM